MSYRFAGFFAEPSVPAPDVLPEYLALMQAFGLTDSQAMNFAPFFRGFWGEN